MSAIAETSGRAISDTGPFALIPEWVLDLKITSTAVRLYAVLGRYADTKGVCWPSRRTLAKRLNVNSPTTVDNAMAELKKVGAVVVHQRSNPETGQTSNLYQIMRANQLVGDPLPINWEGGVPENGEAPLPENWEQNDSQLEREPVEREHSLEERPQDKLFLRLVKVCTGSRVAVFPEATKVLELLRQHFSDHLIDEGIGVCELLSTPPTLPRYLLKVLQDRAEETGTYVPDLSAEFKGEAA